MSYCVNCGVKLDPSLKYCPLCNTPVINPHDLSKMQPVSPFPKEKGQVEVVRRKDLAILLSVSLTAAGLCSLLLNLLVFRQHLWSLYVIGACVLIWVMSIPAVIYTKLPIYLSLLFDGLAVMLYQFLIGFNTTDHSWFFGLSLPITALCTLAAILFAFCLRKISSAFLMKALYFFAEAALLCAGIELLIRRYLLLPLRLTWSAVVCSVCGVIVISLIHGGHSTTIYRSGTPALSLAAAAKCALSDAISHQKERYETVSGYNRFLREELSKIPGVSINSPEDAVPHILNVSVKGIRGTRMQQALNEKGICVSVKSACAVEGTPSKAVYAVCRDRNRAMNSFRISLSHLTTKKELDTFLQAFLECCKERE